MGNEPHLLGVSLWESTPCTLSLYCVQSCPKTSNPSLIPDGKLKVYRYWICCSNLNYERNLHPIYRRTLFCCFIRWWTRPDSRPATEGSQVQAGGGQERCCVTSRHSNEKWFWEQVNNIRRWVYVRSVILFALTINYWILGTLWFWVKPDCAQDLILT